MTGKELATAILALPEAQQNLPMVIHDGGQMQDRAVVSGVFIGFNDGYPIRVFADENLRFLELNDDEYLTLETF